MFYIEAGEGSHILYISRQGRGVTALVTRSVCASVRVGESHIYISRQAAVGHHLTNQDTYTRGGRPLHEESGRYREHVQVRARAQSSAFRSPSAGTESTCR
jgi:hypothetical protein